MKKTISLSLATLALPLSLWAQDDMYFVPTKANVEKSATEYALPRNTYYSGSRRSIDDYNHRQSSIVQPIDSLGNDVIDFDDTVGMYPDSTDSVVDHSDYQYTRRMNRFDDYEWHDPYREGYYAGRADAYYRNDPWYWDYPYYGYSSWYWHSPYYYSGWGWYNPWYYDSWYYNSWYWPHYHPAHVVSYQPRRWGGNRQYTSGIFNGVRNTTDNRTVNSRRYSERQNNSVRNNNQNTTFSRPSSASSSRSSSFSSGSFGGARSGGSFGGGRSGGSGSFGGRR